MFPSLPQITEGTFNTLIALGITIYTVDDFKTCRRMSKWPKTRARLLSVSVESGERNVGVGEETDYQMCYWVQAVYVSTENSAISAVKRFGYSQNRSEEEACARNMNLDTEIFVYYDPKCCTNNAFSVPSMISPWLNAFICLLLILWFAACAAMLFAGRVSANLGGD